MGSYSLLNNLQINNLSTRTLTILDEEVTDISKKIEIFKSILKAGRYNGDIIYNNNVTGNNTLFITHSNTIKNFINTYEIYKYRINLTNYNYESNLNNIISATDLIETNNIILQRYNKWEIIDENNIKGTFNGFKHFTSRIHVNGKVEISKNVNGFTATVYDENDILLNTVIYTHI